MRPRENVNISASYNLKAFRTLASRRGGLFTDYLGRRQARPRYAAFPIPAVTRFTLITQCPFWYLRRWMKRQKIGASNYLYRWVIAPFLVFPMLMQGMLMKLSKCI